MTVVMSRVGAVRARVSDRSSARAFLIGLGWNGSSTIVLQAVRFVTTLIAARRAGPVSWGVWGVLAVVITYAPNLSFGVFNAMNREAPMLIAAGDRAEANRIIGTVRRFVFVVVAIVVAGMAVASVLVPGGELRNSLRLAGPLVAVGIFWIFEQSLLRCENRFDLLGQAQFVLAAAMVCTVPAAAAFGLSGFIVGQTVAIGAGIVFARLRTSGAATHHHDWPLTVALARRGFPTLFVGLLFTVFNTIDRLLIGWGHGQTGLGIYGFATSLSLVAQLVPTVVADQTYTAMLRDWGEHRSIARARRWMWRQVAMSLGATACLCVASACAFPFVVHWLFPAFVDAIVPAELLLLSPLGLALAFGPANFLNTVDRRGRYLVILVSMIGVYLLIGAALVDRHASIAAIAGLSSATSVTFGIAMTIGALAVKERDDTGCAVQSEGSGR